MSEELHWRFEPAAFDILDVRELVTGTGFFTPAEIAIAAELVEERLQKGLASGYEFVFAVRAGALQGYACFGETPGTEGTFDLYWIVVQNRAQGMGFGRQILAQVEAALARRCARQLYAETSSTEKYAPTRAFYLRTGFREAARLADFYRPGDSKVIYEKRL